MFVMITPVLFYREVAFLSCLPKLVRLPLPVRRNDLSGRCDVHPTRNFSVDESFSLLPVIDDPINLKLHRWICCFHHPTSAFTSCKSGQQKIICILDPFNSHNFWNRVCYLQLRIQHFGNL